jgi:hypothetical protein
MSGRYACFTVPLDIAEENAVADAPRAEQPSDDDLWHTMNRATRDEHLAEDSLAWKNVVGLLLTIVSVGLVLAVLTLILSGS